MPVLLWVTFWSTMMGAAACFGDVYRPIPPKRPTQQCISGHGARLGEIIITWKHRSLEKDLI